MGPGIKGVGSGIRRVGSAIAAPRSGITSHGIGHQQLFEGSGIRLYHFCGLVTLLESRIRNLGTKMELVITEHTLLQVCSNPGVVV